MFTDNALIVTTTLKYLLPCRLLLFLGMFCWYQDTVGGGDADTYARKGFEAWQKNDISQALKLFKQGMKVNDKDGNVKRLSYARAYCAYGYGKLLSERIVLKQQECTQDIYESIIKAFGLPLQISSKEEKNIKQQQKIQKMQDSVTKNIQKLDMFIEENKFKSNIDTLKSEKPDYFKEMEVVD